MKIIFLGPRGGRGIYNFPKLGVSNLVPGENYEVPSAAGRVLINTGLAEPAREEDEAPDEISELAEAFLQVESDEDSEELTSDDSGSVATESEDEE